MAAAGAARNGIICSELFSNYFIAALRHWAPSPSHTTALLLQALTLLGGLHYYAPRFNVLAWLRVVNQMTLTANGKLVTSV